MRTLALCLGLGLAGCGGEESCVVECPTGYLCEGSKCVEGPPCWLPRTADEPCPRCDPEKRQGNGCFVDGVLVECGEPPPLCEEGPSEEPCWLDAATGERTEKKTCVLSRGKECDFASGWLDAVCGGTDCAPSQEPECARTGCTNEWVDDDGYHGCPRAQCGATCEYMASFVCTYRTVDCSRTCPEEDREADVCWHRGGDGSRRGYEVCQPRPEGC